MHRRLVLVGVSIVLLLSATAAPSSAATSTSYSASFTEQTVQRPCPPEAPPSAFCFTGTGMGTSTPPGGAATEDFAGFVDFGSPIKDACGTGIAGFPDHNAVSISTSSGKLFLTTSGVDCANTGTDNGTWHAVGGTGIFDGATGTGHVQTHATGGQGTPDNPILSSSTYTGTLKL
jgi:hypothetical protein